MAVEVKREGKVFYKIGEVAEITKLPAYVLRFWESEFNFLHPKKSQGKHRVYTAADVDTVMEIKRMLHVEGYTIAGLKRHWNRRRRDGGGGGSVNWERMKKVKSELRTILKMLKSPPE